MGLSLLAIFLMLALEWIHGVWGGEALQAVGLHCADGKGLYLAHFVPFA